MKRSVILGGALAVILLFAFVFYLPKTNGNNIPQVLVQESKTDPSTSTNTSGAASTTQPISYDPDSIVKGQMTYAMTVNYKDGTHKTYTTSIAFPDLALGSVLNFNKKEIASIDFAGTAAIQMPKNAIKIRQNADVLDTVIVYLNSTQVATKTVTKTYALSDLANVNLYAFNIPLTDNLAPGKYVLNFRVFDQIKFYLADFTPKIMTIDASPEFGLVSDGTSLKELYVVNYKPTVATSLDYVPSYVTNNVSGVVTKTYVGNSKTVVVTATNFRPSTPVTFTYDTTDPDYLHFNQSAFFPLVRDISSDPTTDATGTATSRGNINSLYDIQCYHYYAKYTVSDGTNTVNGVLGCTVKDWVAAHGAYPTS